MRPRLVSLGQSFLFTLALTVFLLPSVSPDAIAQGNDFYYCTDRQGNVTITNRHYDQKLYSCRPFVFQNKAFTERVPVESSKRRTASISTRAEIGAAESARISMEAAQTAAQAAYITAEAVQRLLNRQYYIIVP